MGVPAVTCAGDCLDRTEGSRLFASTAGLWDTYMGRVGSGCTDDREIRPPPDQGNKARGIEEMPVPILRQEWAPTVLKNEEPMARTKQKQRSASRESVPVGVTGGRTPPSKMTVVLLGASVLAAIWAAAMLTPGGRIAYVYVFAYSEFYFGVLALVFLSITVMAGVLATDRMMLTIRHRVLLQSAHRTTGIIAVASLVVHVVTKVSMNHVGGIDVIIPFVAANNTFFVGLGTLAGIFMVSVMWTGIVRARFAGRGKPWMWRSLHSLAYLSWPLALVHGLDAGRAAATWVVASYIGCIAMVVIALVVRLSVAINRRKDFSSSTSTSSIKPIGKIVPTATPGVTKWMGRREERPAEVTAEPISPRVVADRGNAPEVWEPVREPARLAPETRTADRDSAGRDYARREETPRDDDRYDDRYDRYEDRRDDDRRDDDARDEGRRNEGRRNEVRREYEQESRGRRYADGEPRRSDRYRDDDRYEERPRSRRRAAEDDYDVSRSGGYVDDDEPVRRRRRSAEEERYEQTTRFAGARSGSRWRSEEEEWNGVPQPRSRRAATDDEPVRRRRRYAEDDDRSGWRADERDRYEVPPRRRPYATEDVTEGRRRATPDPGLADSGRHSLADLVPPMDSREMVNAERSWDSAGNWLPPDDTPTLIDLASRRTRRDVGDGRGSSRGARRFRAETGVAEESVDDVYRWQVRGEAQ